MRTMQYSTGDNFVYLDRIKRESFELFLHNAGREHCKPYHAFSGTRDEYILHFVLSGQGFYSEGGTTWSLGEGQMFLICPNQPVVYCADRHDPWSYEWIGINGSRAKHLLRQCGFSQERLVLTAPSQEELDPLFDEMFSCASDGYPGLLMVESLLLRLLALLCRHYERSAPVKHSNREYNIYVSRAIAYISKRLSKGVTVTEIANHLGISRTHLNVLFRNDLNLSTQQFLLDLRLQRAAYLLATTSLSVKEISGQIGYQDALVFSKAFKRKYVMSPTEYRAQNTRLDPDDGVGDT